MLRLCERRGDLDAGLLREIGQQGEDVLVLLQSHGFCDGGGEFIRAGGRGEDHGRRVPGLGAVFLHASEPHGGVRVDEIVFVLPRLADGRDRFVLREEVAGEEAADLFHELRRRVVFAGSFQLVHERICQLGVAEEEEQALEVRGDQDVHRRADGLEEFARAVVDARADEVGEDVVAVGGAEEARDGQSHLLGEAAGENVAEIPRRNGDVDLFAHFDLSFVHEVAVCRDIVDDLRDEPTPVDGVGGGEEESVFIRALGEVCVRKDRLDAVLRVVEIAADCHDVHVIAAGRLHLPLLHQAHAVHRIEHGDLHAVDVLVAFKSRLSGVAAGCDEDVCDPSFPGHDEGAGEQTGHDLERHVLERGGRSVPELQRVDAVVQRVDGRGAAGEAVGRISSKAVVEKRVLVVIFKIEREDERRALRVAHGAEGFEILVRERRDGFGEIKSAVRCETVLDRLGGGDERGICGIVAGGFVVHDLCPLFSGFRIFFISADWLSGIRFRSGSKCLRSLPESSRFPAVCPRSRGVRRSPECPAGCSWF